MKRDRTNRGVTFTAVFFYIALSILFSTQARAQADAIQTNVPALKTVYAHDFYIGCILSYRHVGFPDDPVVPGQSPVIAPNGGNLVRFHMNSMSPGNNMKAENTLDIAASAAAYAAASTQALKDSADIHPVVRFNVDMIAQLNWAKRQGFTFRGHVLIWHQQTPAQFFRSGYTTSGTRLTKEKMIQRMDHYLHEIIRLIHEGWPGLFSAMDVVNEAVNDGTGTDRTTGTEWYSTFGDNSYIMKAFELVRKYTVQYSETQMKLYYNDYNTENPAKADGIVRVCGPIFRAGYLDGIGLQGHDAIGRPTAAQWIAAYNKFDPICSEMAITEYYVEQGTTRPTAADLAAQANQYAMLFKLYIERSAFSGRGKIINCTKDGLNDQYDFRPTTLSHLWNPNNQCKPAFYAVANVGIHYNELDSLIFHADSLHQNDYTAESWSPFAVALATAKNAMSQNYSASVSAADALGDAKDALETAVDGLVKTSSDIQIADNLDPDGFELLQNYPNPFNANTTIEFSLSEGSDIRLEVFDVTGRVVADLAHGNYSIGHYKVDFNGLNLESGTYFYKLAAGKKNCVKKLLLLK